MYGWLTREGGRVWWNARGVDCTVGYMTAIVGSDGLFYYCYTQTEKINHFE